MVYYKPLFSGPNLCAFNLCSLWHFADVTKTAESILRFSNAKISGFKRLHFRCCSADLSKARVKPVLPGSRAGWGRGLDSCPWASWQLYPNQPVSPWSGDVKKQEQILSLMDQKNLQINNLPSHILGFQELKEKHLYRTRLCYKMT